MTADKWYIFFYFAIGTIIFKKLFLYGVRVVKKSRTEGGFLKTFKADFLEVQIKWLECYSVLNAIYNAAIRKFKPRIIPEPFKGEDLPDSEIKLELIYHITNDYPETDIDFAYPVDLRSLWGNFLKENQIIAFKGNLTIKGKKVLKSGDIRHIFLTGLETLIVVRYLRPIQSYSLDGKLLWSIQSCEFPKGWKVRDYGSLLGIKKGKDGRDWLLIFSWPAVFATDLLTGQGTHVCEVVEYTEREKDFI